MVIIAGPTASGKSAMAMDVAERFSGTVINADSQQVYRELRLLSARPDEADEARVPHRLYGVLAGDETCSAGRWVEMAAAEIETCWRAGRLPVVAGGTGMYIQALMEGLSPIPDIPGEVRERARIRHDEMGAEAFHGEVATFDPVTAARVPPGDTQRLLRAWEVFQHTQKPFSAWRDAPRIQVLPQARFATIALEPPRDVLYAAIDGRFSRMVEQGALDEVRALLDLGLAPEAPVMKALGVPELAAYLGGETSLENACMEAQKLSRNYAKRQLTWLRHQFHADLVLSAQYSESFRGKIFSFVHQFLLTGGA